MINIIICSCSHPQIEYFLRKQTEAMGGSWIEEKFEEYKLQLSSKHQCLNVWELIELVGMGHFSKGMDRQTLSMGINEVFQELILDMLKQVRGVRLQYNRNCIQYTHTCRVQNVQWQWIEKIYWP